MSALKYQLRLILPQLSKEANANQDKEVKRHLYLIKAVCSSSKSVKSVCESRGVSTDQFYHWGKRLLRFKSILCLKSQSRRPKRSPSQTSKQVERKIHSLRRAEPSHGPERISFDLKRLFKIICPPTTVYNVLRRLKLISIEYSRKLTKKHFKRYRRPLPGYVQMDVKYVPYKVNGEQFYEFNAVDHCTTWRLIRAYKSLAHESIRSFLKELDAECPFPIFEIQTDNGQEFTDKYRGGLLKPSGEHPLDLWCLDRGIVHRLIPVGQKELNGKVENTHKQDDREFYAGSRDETFEKLELRMRSYNERWNNLRFTKSLGWRTPNQCIKAACVRAIAYLKVMTERYPPELKSLHRLSSLGNIYLSVPESTPRARKPKKRRKMSMADRYMQWHEWEQKQKLKALISMPVMSQNFSRVFFWGFMLLKKGRATFGKRRTTTNNKSDRTMFF
jgi:transposase InsO family protein